MFRKKWVLFGLGIALLTSVAGGQGGANPRDPVLNFDYVWNRLDRNYAQFEVKHVDWPALYRVYRPLVTSATTDGELWNILISMLGHLNDAHVCLADGSRRDCAGLTEGLKREDFSLDLVRSKYLNGQASDELKGKLVHGWLAPDVGYVWIGDFKGGVGPIIQAVDKIMASFSAARAVVVDVRNNPGGEGQAAEAVAARFADRPRHYLSQATRYGPKHDDLIVTAEGNIEPDGPVRFQGPTILLTNRFSASAADMFALAMRVMPHVTLVGDLTEGAFSAQFPDRMPNGWILFVAHKVMRDQNGVCWDGLGLPPDLRIVNTAADIASGRDRVLEFARRLLEQGPPAPQEESDSLRNVKTSLVNAFVRRAAEKGADVAAAELERSLAAGGAAFFSFDEAMPKAGQFLSRGKYAEALGLLQAMQKTYPQVASVYAMQARAHLGLGDVAAAEAAMKRGEKVEPMLPFEAGDIEAAKTALRKTKFGSAAAMCEKALAEGGLAAAEKAFLDLSARRGPDGPVFDEADFNRLGYRLLQAGSIEPALWVFDKYVRLFPDSANAFDSLGEAQEKAGLKEAARESYRKSLALNPANANAKARLKELEKRP